MELTAKIFVIIGTIVGSVLIVPLIFGFIALKKIGRDDYTIASGVLTLIFCSRVAGILMIVIATKKPKDEIAKVIAE